MSGYDEWASEGGVAQDIFEVKIPKKDPPKGGSKVFESRDDSHLSYCTRGWINK
jgi:hypothetical protein